MVTVDGRFYYDGDGGTCATSFDYLEPETTKLIKDIFAY